MDKMALPFCHVAFVELADNEHGEEGQIELQ